MDRYAVGKGSRYGSVCFRVYGLSRCNGTDDAEVIVDDAR